MMIPILMSISPDQETATIEFYKDCARCANKIGPFMFFEMKIMIDAMFCITCESLNKTRREKSISQGN